MTYGSRVGAVLSFLEVRYFCNDVGMVLDLRASYLGSIADITEFVRFGQTEHRIVSGSRDLRALLWERKLDDVCDKLGAQAKFFYAGRFDIGAEAGMLLQWDRKPITFDPNAEGKSRRELCDEKVLTILDQDFTVGQVVRVAANGEGGVHWNSVKRAEDVNFVKATAGMSMSDETMDEFSATASLLPAIAEVVVRSLVGITAAVQARSTL